MKKGLLLTLATMATLTLASCGNNIEYIEELPYKEELSSSEKTDLLDKLYDELDNVSSVEKCYETYYHSTKLTTTEKKTFKYTYYEGYYRELEWHKEETSNSNVSESKYNSTFTSYKYLDGEEEYFYESYRGCDYKNTKLKLSSLEIATLQKSFYKEEAKPDSLFWGTDSKAYKNGDGYALVIDYTTDKTMSDKNKNGEAIVEKTKTQYILEVDSNYRIVKSTFYMEDYSNTDASNYAFDELTLASKLMTTCTYSYNQRQEKPSNFMDHFKEEE